MPCIMDWCRLRYGLVREHMRLVRSFVSRAAAGCRLAAGAAGQVPLALPDLGWFVACAVHGVLSASCVATSGLAGGC